MYLCAKVSHNRQINKKNLQSTAPIKANGPVIITLFVAATHPALPKELKRTTPVIFEEVFLCIILRSFPLQQNNKELSSMRQVKYLHQIESYIILLIKYGFKEVF